MRFTIRDARPEDADTIFGFIMDLARYEKLDHTVTATPGMVRTALFEAPQRAFAILGEYDGAPAGFALCYYTYATFMGSAGIHIEDLYIAPEHRAKGLGRSLFVAIAQRAVRDGCARVEWHVLDWNTPALKFYDALGAVSMSDWKIQRLSGAALQALAA